MKLYHFTCPWKFWGDDWKSRFDPETGMIEIPQRDLIPSAAQYEGCPPIYQIPVVWLTTSEETKPSEAPNTLCVRLTVRIPSGDLRLRSFRKYYPAVLPPPFHAKARKHWWVYRGTVPAEWIMDATFLSGERPWWEVPPLSGGG